MTIGPVQLLVLGFQHPDFRGEIAAELERLRDNHLVRVVDMLGVHKDARGNVSAIRESQLDREEKAEVGALVGALIGLGEAGTEGMLAGAERGAEKVEQRGGVLADDAWDVLADIPNDSAAALILLEHRWAIPLRDAVFRAGGTRLASEFISPLDLIELGMVSAEEARRLEAADAGAL